MLGGLLFALPAIVVLYLTAVKPLMLAVDARDWLKTEATLVSTQLKTTRTDDGESQRVIASYWFELDGRKYHSTRVSIHEGSDNIGSYHERMAATLRRSLNEGTSVPVYFDPQDPNRALLDRSLRFELLAFVTVITGLFLALGIGLCSWGYRGRLVNRSPEVRTQPWLAHPDWQGTPIVDTHKLSLMVMAGSTLLWNLLTWPITLHVFTSEREIPVWASVLIASMALVGLYLIWRCIRLYRDGKVRGDASVTLNPFPGRIGGVVGGQVDWPDMTASPTSMTHTLQLERHQWTRSGKSRRKSVDVIWQDEAPSTTVATIEGRRTHFAIKTPENLSSSDVESKDVWHQWHLIVECTLDTGRVIESRFVIPVYQVDEVDTVIERPVGIARQRERLLDSTPDKDWSGSPIRHESAGLRQLDFPIGHDLSMPLGATLFGLVFAGAGIVLAVTGLGEERQWIPLVMSIPFLLIGLLVTLWGLTELISARTVSISHDAITSTRRLFGIVVRQRTAALSAVTGFAIKDAGSSSSGGKTRLYFTINAALADGSHQVVAWRIEGRPKARSVIGWLCTACGVEESDSSDSADSAVEDIDTGYGRRRAA